MDIKFVNQKDLSVRWNISRKTLEKWRWLGMGPRYLKLGNRVRYSITDIENFEASNFLKHTAEEYLKKNESCK